MKRRIDEITTKNIKVIVLVLFKVIDNVSDKILKSSKTKFQIFNNKILICFFVKNLLPNIGERVKATNEDITIEKDRAIAVFK